MRHDLLRGDPVVLFDQDILPAVTAALAQILFVVPDQIFGAEGAVVQSLLDGIGKALDTVKVLLDVLEEMTIGISTIDA